MVNFFFDVFITPGIVPPMPFKPTIQYVKAALGGRSLSAEKLGISPSMIDNWGTVGIAEHHHERIIAETDGRVTAADLKTLNAEIRGGKTSEGRKRRD